MKNFQNWSREMLEKRIESLNYDIADWERTLSYTNSFLICRVLESYIGKAKKEIRAIQAELCLRDHEDN
jgi:hypothetical protein